MKSNAAMHENLIRLFHDIMDIEEKAVITEEFKDISNKDMHIIEAIGIDNPKNMSAVAKALSVTVGTLTIAINSLVKKGYVSRERSSRDRRVVLLSLTNKGTIAFHHHKRFHKEMSKAVLDGLSDSEAEVFVGALTNLKDFFYNYEK